jgi:CheY-like chemotaxis protein
LPRGLSFEGHEHAIPKCKIPRCRKFPTGNKATQKRAQVMNETSIKNTVLIVDHYRVGQRIALMQLSYFGLSAQVVTSCFQAMLALKKQHYSLVLIGWGRADCNGADCNGANCIEFIRRLDARRSTKTTIVAVTAHSRFGDKERCVAAGMNDLLCKPITMEHMQQMINQYLKAA